MNKYQRRTKLKRSRSRSSSKRSKRMTTKRAKGLYKKGGGVPASYVGSIQGEFINNKGQQLFRNPVGGIA